VFLGNVSLLTSEISGIETIMRSIDEVPVDRFGNLDALVDYMDRLFRMRTMHAGYPEAVYALVKRKLSKVSQYIQSIDE